MSKIPFKITNAIFYVLGAVIAGVSFVGGFQFGVLAVAVCYLLAAGLSKSEYGFVKLIDQRISALIMTLLSILVAFIPSIFGLVEIVITLWTLVAISLIGLILILLTNFKLEEK